MGKKISEFDFDSALTLSEYLNMLIIY